MALAHTEKDLTTSYCSLRPMGDMAAMGEGLMVIIMGEGLMLIIMGEGLMLIIPPCIMSNNIEQSPPCNNTAVPVSCARWCKSRLLEMQDVLAEDRYNLQEPLSSIRKSPTII